MNTPSGENKDEGFFYAPYIMDAPPAINLDEFTIKKSLITKYTKKIVNPDWYGTVTLADLGKPPPKLVQGWLFDDDEAC